MLNLDIALLFKLGAVSIIIIILEKILKTSGKDEFAVVINIAGIVIILMMVIGLISKLFNEVKALFQF